MRLSALSVGGVLLAVGLAGVPQANAQTGLTFPSPGVVCDQAGRACYDSYGPSAGYTQENFGPEAAERLARNMDRAGSRDFRLSTGQACIIAKRTCYDDGWSQTNVAGGLTKRLFGSVPSSSSSGNFGDDKRVIRDSGLCSLSRGGDAVFDGPCQLKQVIRDGLNTFVVQLQNGNRYVFKQAGSGYTISDGFGGSWPATFVDHGNSGVFRFGDYKLVATQDSLSRPASTTPSSGAATGEALGSFLKALFTNK
ncbi:MAG: YcgJ family protein [Cyanobium sp.]